MNTETKLTLHLVETILSINNIQIDANNINVLINAIDTLKLGSYPYTIDDSRVKKIEALENRLKEISDTKGFSTILLSPGSKLPWKPFCGLLSCNKEKSNAELKKKIKNLAIDTSVDPDTINIGVRTGWVSGITVIDFDLKSKAKETTKSGMPMFEIVKSLMEIEGKKTLTVQTPSGGYHLFFKYNGSGAFKTRAGTVIGGQRYAIDIRNDRGYVAYAGSTVDGNGYTIVDDSPICEMPESVQKLFGIGHNPIEVPKRTFNSDTESYPNDPVREALNRRL
jgi:hypothetical protein